MAKALFNVGVFGLAARIDKDGTIRLHVNVRGDEAEQLHQWKLANLAPIPGVKMIDCPGGAVKPGDLSLVEALRREVQEETDGCKIQLLTSFDLPLELMKADMGTSEKPFDLAFWCPVVLIGEPKPSAEASDHPWITAAEFDAETPYRPVSGLGKAGRTGRMMRAALDWFEKNKGKPEIFS